MSENLSTDPTGLESRIPNFGKKFANIHYQSEITGEFGIIYIQPKTTEDDIMNQYSQKFPRECKFYLSTVREINKTLNTPTGMGKEARIMSLTKIPEIIYTCMKFLNVDYWMDKKAIYRFVRKYPGLAVGSHGHKQREGVIIK